MLDRKFNLKNENKFVSFLQNHPNQQKLSDFQDCLDNTRSQNLNFVWAFGVLWDPKQIHVMPFNWVFYVGLFMCGSCQQGIK